MKRWKKFISSILAIAIATSTLPASFVSFAQDNSFKIEAETGYMVDRDGEKLDQAPATDDQHASGGAYYGHFDDGAGRGLILENVSETDATSLSIKYASYNQGTFDIYINASEEAYQLAFIATGDWYMDTGREVSANIEIPAGATIKIVPSRPANIDYITLGSRAADSELIEAETGYMVDRNGNQIDQAPATDDQYASGGAYYGHFDEGEEKGLVLENVTSTAKTSLSIKYASSNNQGTFAIYINDEESAYQLSFSATGGWYMNTGREASGCIEIPAGATIRIVPSRPANIDYIVLGTETDLPAIPNEDDFVLIEAETGYMVDRGGNRIDQAPATDDEYASGGAYYDHFDSGERKGLILENNTGEDKTSIAIRYASKGYTGTFDLYINDSKTARQLAFTSTSDWYMNTSNIVSGRIDIPDGATIKIVPSNPANIDYIVLGNDETLPVIPEETVSREQELARQMETESIVLAQNDGVLPLSEDTKIAVFGSGQLAPATGGSGSGAANGEYTSNFIDGLYELGIEPYQELLEYYEERVHSNRDIDHGWDTSTEYPDEWGTPVYSGTSWSHAAGVNTPDVKLDNGEITDDGIVARAAQESDVAIVYITRTTGAEEMDRIEQPGDWNLNASERVLLEQVSDKFDRIVAILSINGPIEMSWVKEYGVDAVMISYASGSQNGYAMADLVFGKENPSAKLADTIVETYDEHPTADTFGYITYSEMGLDGEANHTAFGDEDPISPYLENIYVGYRYFDTFGKEVLYPFGSGLSYSDFAFEDMDVGLNAADKSITVSATIENVTEDPSIVPGKEVMEVYVSIPDGKLEQPYQKLVDYEKSEELAAGESQRISIDVPLKDLASYDEERAAYILEPGTYYLRVGSSSRDTHIAGAFTIEDTIVVEQLTNQLVMSDDAKALFEEKALTKEGATPITYDGEAEEMQKAEAEAFTVTADDVEVSLEAPTVTEPSFRELPEDEPVHKFSEVQSGDISLEDFVAQMTEDELITFLSGGNYRKDDGVGYSDDSGIPENFASKASGVGGAGQTRNIERFSIPSITFADGSAGIGYSAIPGVRDKNIGWPRAAAMACIWNKELLREFAVEMGKAMLDINVDVWLAPSINLHRNPLGGRGNEYYSEDPILSGLVASVVAEGVAESGVTVCLKHFAGNDQEYYRRGVINDTTEQNGTSRDAINVIATERTLREIYLKPFEMAVKTGKVMNVMSAFNKINGQYCASNEGLLTDILRGEWGFQGFVVTDWGDYDVLAHEGHALAAGNDLNMPGGHNRYWITNKYRESLADGSLTLDQMRRSAYRLLNTIQSSALSSMPKKHNFASNLSIQSTTLPDAKIGFEYSESKVNPLIAAGGKGSRYSFQVAADSPAQLPEGITLRPNGALTGIPAAGTEGSYDIKFQVTDNTGASATKQLTLTVNGELSIAPEELPVVVLNEAYEQKLTASDAQGNPVDAIFTTTDALPTGLTLSEDGTIRGTCTDIGDGVFDITISVVSKDGSKTGTVSYKLDAISSTAQIATESLEDAVPGEFYSFALSADGGVQPYTWEVSALPEGFVLHDGAIKSGRLSGKDFLEQTVPESAEGVYEIEVKLTDSIGYKDTKTFLLKVGNPDEEAFAITTGSLETGRVGASYETVLTSINGEGDVRYTLAEDSDSLPDGMTLSEDGILSGTPSLLSSNLYRIVIHATDGSGSTCDRTYSLYIAGQLTADPAAFQVLNASEGKAFKQSFSATGGYNNEYKFELAEGSSALPAGLSMTSDSSGMTISGTPEPGTAGTYELLILMDAAEFGGNPVTSVIPYTLVVEPEEINLALEKDVYASSYIDMPPEWAVDGNMGTRWSCYWQDGDVDTPWLTVDLGADYAIYRAVIYWETAQASEYVIQVSDDNETFTPVDVVGRSLNGNTHTWEIEATGRYIRMQSIKAATKWGSSIFEFEVYGTPAEETDYSIASKTYAIDAENAIVSGIPAKTTAEDVLSELTCQAQDATIQIVDASGEALDGGGMVASQMKVQVVAHNEVRKEYVVSVLGDLDGSGGPSEAAIEQIQSYILGDASLNLLQVLSADVKPDGKINVQDLVLIKKSILLGQ